MHLLTVEIETTFGEWKVRVSIRHKTLTARSSQNAYRTLITKRLPHAHHKTLTTRSSQNAYRTLNLDHSQAV